jgi:AraC-like DNA-binding protein
MDALSDVLKSVRLEGAVYLNAEFTAPWCIRGECGIASVREHLSGAEHVAYFHFLTEGECQVRLVDGGEALRAVAGDLVLFPQEGKHLMGSDIHRAPLEAEGMAKAIDEIDAAFFRMRHGGGGKMTRFVCGYLAFSRSVSRPLLEALPRVLCIPLGGASAPMRELLALGVRESAAARPGGASILAKAAELMFVEALRRYAETLPPEGKGWLAGARDAHVGRALALLHAEPGKAWTVDELAREVAISRSALAARFAELVGEPPMQYLKRWRLALAAKALRSGEGISRIAARSGYDSEAAFTRAFKREFGAPPAAWKKHIGN